MESIEEERERSAFSSESDSDNYESQRAKKKKVKAQYPKTALDVAYAAYRNSPISNITNLVNDFTPAQEQNLKSTICSTLLGTTPPLNFNCEFCWDDNSFYNVTQFCMLKSVYINAINRTMFELNNWMEDINYCKWVGVKCDDSNNVVELLLEFPIIPRFLDTRIGQLKTLQKFTLIGGNKLPNNLMSTSLFQLENLRELFITSTGLTGKIPNTFDKMTSLKTLRLTNNRQLSDPIPDSIAKTSLEILVYAMQNITGVIPDFIGNSPTLQQSLIMLDLSSNLYTGGIPDSIMNLKNLKTLSVAFNLLSGEFPSIITSKFAKSLVFLDLNSNNFSGIIPPSIVQCENLKTINLESNSFTGQIPAELSKLQLFDLLLSDNKLSGEIPATIGDIKRLAINGLTGLIPNGICQQKYSFCDLHTNQFTSVPASCS
ncbi:14853_t:CDS:2, partial [Rhizophagus irregularis]